MIINDVDSFKKFCSDLREVPEVTIDTETNGLKPWADSRMCGIGFCFPDESTYYLPFRHKEFSDGMDLLAMLANPNYNLPLDLLPELWDALRTVPRLIGHNIKFDLAVMYQDGYDVSREQEIEDTLPGARICYEDPEPDMSLEGITRSFFGIDESEWKGKFKKYLSDRKIKDYSLAEIPVIAEYCEGDCKSTYRARNHFKKHAEETDQGFIYNIEKRLMSVVWGMEKHGLALDQDYIRWAIEQCNKAREEIMGKIAEIVGYRFNVWSNQQLTEAMNSQGIRSPSFTPTGLSQWTDDVLQKMTEPLAKLILDWRTVDKMLNTFFIPYSELESALVHPTFKSWGAVTGRFSCSDPNLQQLSRPIDWKDTGFTCEWFDVQVRRMFTAPEGFRLVLIDYSQMEMIGFADYIEDSKLRAILNEAPIDFHSLVAKLIWNLSGEEPTFKKWRSRAKAISLGLVYMMGIDKLARSLDLTEDEARALKKKYFQNFPTANNFINGVVDIVERRGYVFNRFKRRYYLKDQFYKAINYLVQGTCADIIKQAMIRIDDLLWGMQSRLAFQMHDEFGFYIHESEWEVLREIVRIMEDVPIKTKMFVEVSEGIPSWADKKEVCKTCLGYKEKGHLCESSYHLEETTSADFVDKKTGRKLGPAKKGRYVC